MSDNWIEYAFPHPSGGQCRDGMTLRDWFAGLVASQCIRNSLSVDDTWDPDNVAFHAYLLADAMMKERSK